MGLLDLLRPPKLTDEQIQIIRRGKILRALDDRDTYLTPIPRDKMIVVGGAAMQIYGIKDTQDIDVVVTPDVIQQIILTKRPPNVPKIYYLDDPAAKQLVEPNTGQVIDEDNYGIDVGAITYMPAPNHSLYQATFDELRDEARKIGGFLVSPPRRILEWKRALNRPKDLIDISLLEEYVSM